MLFKPSKIISSYSTNNAGFTLIELIIGIVVLSISLSIISTLIVPTEQKSADQIHQVKAAELGQSFLNDISARAFDHKSDMAGGRVRCGEPNDGSNPCTDASKLGPEDGIGGRIDAKEYDRKDYNDVDDFNGYKSNENSLDDSLGESYSSFIIDVDVRCAEADLGLAPSSDCKLAKRITVTVTTPLGTAIKFATHKANF
jgi:MSHA pilin protein MshD